MLTVGSTKNVHDLGDLLALVVFVAASDRVLDAMSDVIAQDLLLGAAERSPYRGYLGHYVDAVAVFFDHAGNAPDLAFDATEPFQHGGFRFGLHA